MVCAFGPSSSARLLVICVLSLFILTTLTALARAQDQSGREPFARVCAACHGLDAKGKVGPSLLPFDRDYQEVRGIVREGRGEMPAISPADVSDEELMNIVRYLKTLSSDAAGPARSAPAATLSAVVAPAKGAPTVRSAD